MLFPLWLNPGMASFERFEDALMANVAAFATIGQGAAVPAGARHASDRSSHDGPIAAKPEPFDHIFDHMDDEVRSPNPSPQLPTSGQQPQQQPMAPQFPFGMMFPPGGWGAAAQHPPTAGISAIMPAGGVGVPGTSMMMPPFMMPPPPLPNMMASGMMPPQTSGPFSASAAATAAPPQGLAGAPLTYATVATPPWPQQQQPETGGVVVGVPLLDFVQQWQMTAAVQQQSMTSWWQGMGSMGGPPSMPAMGMGMPPGMLPMGMGMPPGMPPMGMGMPPGSVGGFPPPVPPVSYHA